LATMLIRSALVIALLDGSDIQRLSPTRPRGGPGVGTRP
jgi:hypothetical protein